MKKEILEVTTAGDLLKLIGAEKQIELFGFRKILINGVEVDHATDEISVDETKEFEIKIGDDVYTCDISEDENKIDLNVEEGENADGKNEEEKDEEFGEGKQDGNTPQLSEEEIKKAEEIETARKEFEEEQKKLNK